MWVWVIVSSAMGRTPTAIGGQGRRCYSKQRRCLAFARVARPVKHVTVYKKASTRRGLIQVPRRRLGWRVTAGILAALLSAPARWRTPTETDAGCVSCAPATSRRMFPYATLHPGDVRQPRAMGASAPMHASKGHGQPGPVDCDYVPQLTLRGSVAASRPARYQGYIRRLPLLIVARLFIIGAADAVRRGPGALVSARGRGWYFASPCQRARCAGGIPEVGDRQSSASWPSSGPYEAGGNSRPRVAPFEK